MNDCSCKRCRYIKGQWFYYDLPAQAQTSPTLADPKHCPFCGDKLNVGGTTEATVSREVALLALWRTKVRCAYCPAHEAKMCPPGVTCIDKKQCAQVRLTWAEREVEKEMVTMDKVSTESLKVLAEMCEEKSCKFPTTQGHSFFGDLSNALAEL